MHIKFDKIVIIVFLFFVHSSFAQVAKKIIVEHFTNTRCSICANPSKNPAFYTNLEAHPDALHISYHPSSPYASCVLNKHNKEENDGRTNYHGVYGSTPVLVVQGKRNPNSISFGNPALFENHEGETSEFSMSIDQTKNAETIVVTVNIKALSASNYTGATILVGVAEKMVNYNAPNGENLHYDVFRKAMTDITGDAINLPANGETVTLSYSMPMNAEWELDEIFAYAVINNAAKGVIQAAAATPEEFSVSTSAANTLTGLSVFPNPVEDRLQITLNDGQHTTARLFDVSGRFLFETIFTDNTNIDFTPYASGIYFIEIRNMNGSVNQKVVKE